MQSARRRQLEGTRNERGKSMDSIGGGCDSVLGTGGVRPIQSKEMMDGVRDARITLLEIQAGQLRAALMQLADAHLSLLRTLTLVTTPKPAKSEEVH
jgi:hypothetical protein